MRVKRIAVFLIVISLTLPYPAKGIDIPVTRWLDPLGLPKPLHKPMALFEQLSLEKVDLPSEKYLQSLGKSLGRVCIIIHQDVATELKSSLIQYESDLMDMGFTTITYLYFMGSAKDLRTYLTKLYKEPESSGRGCFDREYSLHYL